MDKKRLNNFFDTPWHTESRSNGANYWFVMRGHHQDPIGYELGLMVTKCAHQVDGRMDRRMPLEPFYYLGFQLS
jgi:hypothetical protein